jgi:protein subunit release factor A
LFAADLFRMYSRFAERRWCGRDPVDVERVGGRIEG